jgi:GTPase SAR1 family protein
MALNNKPFGIGNQVLLDKIDKLFANNVGDYVDLPQLIVVGDQSSGKSSILEGLIDFPFPRDAGLCTRFATQIIFRRSNDSSMNVSIIPGNSSSLEHSAEVKVWNKTNFKVLDSQYFAEIIKEVSLMPNRI